MNILISGGAGFIGSHLCDAVLKQNNKVIVADKLIMGDQNIIHLKGNDSFKFYDIELSDQNKLDEIFKKENIDVVYHLAANSDIQKGGKEPDIDYNDTLLTTRTILESMRKYNVKNLFFSSTSAVYGDKKDEVLTETTGDLRPISFYGGAKLASESLISSYVSMCDINAIVFRFPNVIGPRLTHGVIYDFVKKLKNNNSELEILGNGKQCKPYIYVFDLIKIICILTNKFETGMNIFNISVNSDGTEVTRVAEIVCEEMGLKNVKFNYTGESVGWKGDVPKFKYNIDKVLSTGWVPKYTSDEAVRQSVRDYLNGVGL